MASPDKWRGQRRSASVDRYLHALLLLTDHGRPADTGELARLLAVSPAAVSAMLKRLSQQRLVHLQRYRGALLTTDGMHQALRIVRRHRLLETFLHRVLGFDVGDVHRRALALEPCVDSEFEERLDAFLGHPKTDPHGKPIPDRDTRWPRLRDKPLLELSAGIEARVSRIMSDEVRAIEYLSRVGLRAGAAIAVKTVAPFEGPISVRVGGKVRHLGRHLATMIRVSPEHR
jgi:DtxR family Mn-dependent transcriptional regulator